MSITPITQYKASDGRILSDREAAEKYETELNLVSEAMRPLGNRLPHDLSSKGWIQHDPRKVSWAKSAVLKIVRPLFLSYPHILKAIDEDPDSVHPMSFVGRLLDDTDSPAASAWSRFACIDEQSREHNQPYFALNGPSQEMTCMEDRR